MSDYTVKRLNEFDPNTPEAKSWATFVPNRSPSFKAHTSRRTALAAMGQHAHGLLFEFYLGRWELVARKAPEDHHGICTVCGGATTRIQFPTYRHRTLRFLPDGRAEVDAGTFKWKRDNHGRLDEPLTLLYLCPNCSPHFK